MTQNDLLVWFPPEGVVIPDKNLVWQTWEYIKSILVSMWWNESELSDVDRIVHEVMSGIRTDLNKAILEIQEIPERKHGNGWHWLMW